MNSVGFTLVTGASGFVGAALLARLLRDGVAARGAVRGTLLPPGCVHGPSLEDAADWSLLLRGCKTIVHAAARVHVMRDTTTEPLAAYRAVNVAGTLSLARQAAAAGVRRFVFLSSIKVNGEHTAPGRPFTAEDDPAPQDAYALSKAEAEAALLELAADNGMEVVVIRPPLVYGPGVKANFLAMMHALQRGLPLPLGAMTCNRRSLVALDNLVDLIVCSIGHPAAANRVLLVKDGEDLSSADLLRRTAAALQVKARLLPVPSWALMAGATLLGKRPAMARLCGNLQVDDSATRQLLGWQPPIDVDEGLRRTVAGLRR
ncbi:NAD-dependent epimerase/dehydratase family protein [Thauera sp. SDU_THAU2]|uniref:NAD-dependent epimerase/dehydratase family protein n=1 Tax=Thauera sp. SDU_THAU2 TaxID=3136633 RepID=UPI00311FF78A